MLKMYKRYIGDIFAIVEVWVGKGPVMNFALRYGWNRT